MKITKVDTKNTHKPKDDLKPIKFYCNSQKLLKFSRSSLIFAQSPYWYALKSLLIAGAGTGCGSQLEIAKSSTIVLVSSIVLLISMVPVAAPAIPVMILNKFSRFFLFTAVQAAAVGVHIRPQSCQPSWQVPQQTGPTP